MVLAGLGILSSLAIPNALKYFDYARVDEAKALLNSAAADCLQGLRRKGSGRLGESVDKNILSNDRLESTGYKFTDIATTSSCGNVLITVISTGDQERMPDLGFTINSEGKLTKIAVDTGDDTSFAAKGWAGKNVTEAAGLKELMDYNQEILDKNNLEDQDISHYLFHQATWKMLDQLRHRMNVDEQRLPIELADIGNTVSCTIPILIDRMRSRGSWRAESTNMLVGFGVGLSWAGCLWEDRYQSR